MLIYKIVIKVFDDVFHCDRDNLLITKKTLRGCCRNLPFSGRATRDLRVRVSRKEYARSRHQRLFEENVGKTGKDVIYEL